MPFLSGVCMVFFFFYLRCFAIFTSTDWEAYADFTVKRRGNRFFFLHPLSFPSLICRSRQASSFLRVVLKNV